MESGEYSEIVRKRSSKTTREQFSIYLDELEKNKWFRTNKYEPCKPEILKETWDLLAAKLNSSGGPKRNTAQWKRIFCDWRSQVKKKAREYKMYQGGTGGGPPLKPLTEIEEKLIALTGNVVVNGLPGIEELGVPGPCTSDVIEPEKKDEMRDVPENCNVSLYEENGNETENKTRNQSCLKGKMTLIKPKKKTFVSSIENLIEKCKTNEKYLKTIDDNLHELVVIKKKQLAIQEIKLKLKYDIDIEYD